MELGKQSANTKLNVSMKMRKTCRNSPEVEIVLLSKANLPSDDYHYDGYDGAQKDETTKDGHCDDSIQTVLGVS